MIEINSIHPDALSWLKKAGLPSVLLEGVSTWNPQTLKQISTHALALGRASGQHIRVMKVLADIEIALKRLRDRIGIPRNAPPDVLARATTLIQRENEWISLGKWIPDVLDRAAAFDPIHSSHKTDQVVTLRELRAYQLQHIILLAEPSSQSSNVVTTEKRLTELRQNDENCTYHTSAIPTQWMSSGPEIFEAVFEAADFIYGIKE
jgi:hypothetical protein